MINKNRFSNRIVFRLIVALIAIMFANKSSAQEENGPDAIYVDHGKTVSFQLTAKIVSITVESPDEVFVIPSGPSTLSIKGNGVGKWKMKVETHDGDTISYLVVVAKKKR